MPHVLPVAESAACCPPLAAAIPGADDSATLAAGFRALGDPVRLRLLGILLTAPDGEVCACDLVEPLERAQPTVSHHLKVLREAGLVRSTRRGTNVWYAPDREGIAAVRSVLDDGS